MDDFKSRGRKAFAEKDYQGAAEIYGEAIKIDLDDAVLYSNRSQCLINLGDWAGAMQDCDRGLTKNPIPSIREKLLYRHAIAAKHLNLLSMALSSLRQLLSISPTNQQAKSELKSVERLLENVPNQNKKLKKSPRGDHIPIEIVDKLPHEFSSILTAQSPTPPTIKRSENKDLVDEFSRELLLDRPAKIQPQPYQPSAFVKRPAMLKLRILDNLPTEKRNRAFNTVLSLKKDDIAELGDVEPEFLELFIDSVSYGIKNRLADTFEMLERLEVIKSLPRFSIALQMCSQHKLESLYETLRISLTEYLPSFQKLLS